jgi:hypothetical protein
MKMMKVRTGLALAALTAAGSFAGAAQAQDACVPYRNIQSIHMIDNQSAVITTPRDAVRVTFRNVCNVVASGEFFVLDRFQLGQCVSPGDAFTSSGVSAPCTIESVVPMAPALENGDE